MVKIAKMYYEEGLTQAAISKQLGISRPKVSRLMQEAMEQGLIRIEIASIPGDFSDVMQKLQSKFNLLEAIVVEVTGPMTYECVSHFLGIAAANYFQRIVRDGDVIGLTWGSALASMVAHLDQDKKPNCLVVQMLGGLGSPDTNTHATDLVIRTAMTLGAKMSLMPAPGLVETIDSAELLIADRHVSQALDLVKKTMVAFVGIGATKHNPFLMRNEEIITWEEMGMLRSQGAVGDISLHFYDRDGIEVESEFQKRVIGVSFEDMKKIPRMVGVAGGPEKYEAILGALQGGIINTLITDSQTAQRLIEE